MKRDTTTTQNTKVSNEGLTRARVPAADHRGALHVHIEGVHAEGDGDRHHHQAVDLAPLVGVGERDDGDGDGRQRDGHVHPRQERALVGEEHLPP